MDDPHEDDELPWVTFNEKTCILGGNADGFRRLRDSINLLLSEEINPVAIEGDEIEICEVRLAGKPQDLPQPPARSTRDLIYLISMITFFLILSAIGFITSVNWLITH